MAKPWYLKLKKDLANKKILIFGLGLLGGGLADARFFAEMGLEVTVTDLKSSEELKASVKKLKDLSIKFVLGKHRNQDILQSSLIIRNPGAPLSSKYLQLAQKKGIEIEMDESLFVQYAPVKSVGVTGTRGKSTVTALVYELLKKAEYPVWLGGNVKGVATLPLLKKVNKRDWAVLELSSWQLQGFRNDKISPNIAIFTNIFEDHLNRYKSMNDYINDKKAIYQFQSDRDHLLINKDNKQLVKIIEEDKDKISSKIHYFSKSDLPDALKKVINLPGDHNLENVAAILALAKLLSIDNNIVIEVVKEFKGLPDRLEKIATVNGVDYINDTTSTTPAAGISALNSFDKPIILIAGGSRKKLKMGGFAKEIAKKAKSVIFLEGEETDKLINLVKKHGGGKKIIEKYSSLREAVLKAKEISSKDNVILLSPGCASFGMFKNEFDRGNKFNKIVRSLKNA
jgi:UDP-N-acetylmuramoylalanine--D-glutamate ligase